MALPSQTTYHRWLGWHAPELRRLVTAAAVGAVVGAAVIVAAGWEFGVLCGWDATALTFLAAVVPIVLRADGPQTRQLAVREDVKRDVARLLLLTASGVSLAAVGLVLASASDEGAARLVLVTIAVLTIVISWTVVNTVFTLRYAHLHYRGSTEGVDFGGAEATTPDYRDFAYLAFTVGMTYQVSDTTLRDRRVRRAVLTHALIAYVFGVVIVSTVVNILAGPL